MLYFHTNQNLLSKMLKFANSMIGSDSSQKDMEFDKEKFRDTVLFTPSLCVVEMILGTAFN